MRPIITILILAFINVGCNLISSNRTDKQSQPFSVKTDQDKYQENQTVTAIFTNNSDSDVAFDPCNTLLQKYLDNKWENVDGYVCVAIDLPTSLTIKSNNNFEYDLHWFRDTHKKGKYRIVFDIRNASGKLLPADQRTSNSVFVEN